MNEWCSPPAEMSPQVFPVCFPEAILLRGDPTGTGNDGRGFRDMARELSQQPAGTPNGHDRKPDGAQRSFLTDLVTRMACVRTEAQQALTKRPNRDKSSIGARTRTGSTHRCVTAYLALRWEVDWSWNRLPYRRWAGLLPLHT